MKAKIIVGASAVAASALGAIIDKSIPANKKICFF
jgi:hypothetical protein